MSLQIFYIGLFGAIGCLSRYFLSGWVHQLFGRNFPYGTLAVNLAGAYLIGFIMAFSLRSELVSPDLRIGLTIGLMGGLTTFSAFSYETFRLLEDGAFLIASINILISVLFCLFFTWAGMETARYL